MKYSIKYIVTKAAPHKLKDAKVFKPDGVFNKVQGKLSSLKKAIGSSQVSSERSIQKKISKTNFEKFKSILLSPQMPLEICIDVWDIVASKVLNLPEILVLLNLPDSPLKYLKNPIMISGSICPYKASQDFSITSGDTVPEDYELWDLRLDQYPNVVIDSYTAHGLINMMKKKEMQFTTMNTTLGPERPYDSNKDFGLAFDDILAMCDEVKINPVELIPTTSVWPLCLTSITVDKESSLDGLEKLQNLKEVILVTDVLLSVFTLNTTRYILKCQAKLQKYVIEYTQLITDPRTIVFTNSFAEVFAPFEDMKIELCSDFQLRCEKRRTNIIDSLLFDFQLHCETRRTSIIDSPEFAASIANIGMYFHSLELTSKGPLSDKLDIFPNLEEAFLSPHCASMDPIFILQNDSLKKLTVVGSLKRGNIQKDLLLYPNKLTNLCKLKISKCRLHYKMFDKLPDTIQSLTLNDCIFDEEDPVQRLIIPNSLQRLSLRNTCPIIEPSSRVNYSPGVQLNLSWTPNGFSKRRLNYKKFDDLPYTFQFLTFSDCTFDEENRVQRLINPASLQRLSLRNTCPRIDPISGVNYSPGDQLNLSWTPNGRCIDFCGLFKIIRTFSAGWVREICFTPPDCFPDYVKIAHVDNKDDTYCFSIQFGEDITSHFKKVYYEKLYYLDVKVTHKRYLTVLKEMAIVCMECFERKNSSVNAAANNDGYQQHMPYESKLRARLKFESYLSWNLSMIETKTPFASTVS
ncbi:unnamed protein product [Ambrosiozyma monospora]|uniref:Unnamed protein product n=1 Tax=Ambrosiozyma monospora TaxID=43982 RepID=A0A9W6YL04_AMBMO|nr:unnamed protein product [Ambrosiozyma monospora]